jgi:transposase-like protein
MIGSSTPCPTSYPRSPKISRTPARTYWRSPRSPNRSGARSGPTTPKERLNKEIRRRTDVVGIFPDRNALIRLVSAVVAEQHDEWAESRRSMSDKDVLSKSRAEHSTPTEQEATPAALTA